MTASATMIGRKANLSLLRPCGLPAHTPAFRALDKQPHRRRQHVCRAQDVDLDSAVDAFMKRQAEIESGAAFARTVDPNKVIGADVVTDEMARSYCREIFETLKTLKATRDMSVNEVKLVVSIEDPRTKERRMQGIEDERGVSRDEMAAALLEVAEGKVPKDRIALKCLWEEIGAWPFLEVPTEAAPDKASKAAPTQSDYQALQGGDTVVKPYIMGEEARAGDKPQDVADMLPSWVGYLTLYGISTIPVLIVIVTVLILFYSSLK